MIRFTNSSLVRPTPRFCGLLLNFFRYYTALRHSGLLGLTTPYLDATGAGVVITAARTLHRGESSRIHQTNDEVLGVMGADFLLTYFYRYGIEINLLIQPQGPRI